MWVLYILIPAGPGYVKQNRFYISSRLRVLATYQTPGSLMHPVIDFRTRMSGCQLSIGKLLSGSYYRLDLLKHFHILLLSIKPCI